MFYKNETQIKIMNTFEVKKNNKGFYQFKCRNRSFDCELGKAGVVNFSKKQEGDNCTPLGKWLLKSIYYRPDKIDLLGLILDKTIKLNKITRNCGWCDDYKSPDYNRHIKIMNKEKLFCYSYENLWRDDQVYDIIIETDFNSNPVVPMKGSAIFVHCSFKDFRLTSGCIAVSKENIILIIKSMTKGAKINII